MKQYSEKEDKQPVSRNEVVNLIYEKIKDIDPKKASSDELKFFIDGAQLILNDFYN